MTELWYPGAYAVNIGGNGNEMSVSVADINDIFHIVAASWRIDPNDPKSLDYSGGYWKNNKPATTYTDNTGIMQQFCPITSCVNGTKDGNYRNNTHEAWNPPPTDGDLNLSRYTPEQAERFADWLYWRAKAHGFVIQDMRDSRRTSHGVGVHRYGITAYNPWKSVGGEIWSTSSTKLCPGDARIVQVQTEIIPRALELVRLDPGFLPPGRVDLQSALSRGASRPPFPKETEMLIVRRDRQTNIDYAYDTRNFIRITDPTHYELLVNNGFIDVPHGKAELSNTWDIAWVRNQVLAWGGRADDYRPVQV